MEVRGECSENTKVRPNMNKPFTERTKTVNHWRISNILTKVVIRMTTYPQFTTRPRKSIIIDFLICTHSPIISFARLRHIPRDTLTEYSLRAGFPSTHIHTFI